MRVVRPDADAGSFSGIIMLHHHSSSRLLEAAASTSASSDLSVHGLVYSCFVVLLVFVFVFAKPVKTSRFYLQPVQQCCCRYLFLFSL